MKTTQNDIIIDHTHNKKNNKREDTATETFQMNKRKMRIRKPNQTHEFLITNMRGDTTPASIG
jgi:hypothetical protein